MIFDSALARFLAMDPVLAQITKEVVQSYNALWGPVGTGTRSCPECTVAVIQGLANCLDIVAHALGEEPENLCVCHSQSEVSPKHAGEWMLDFAVTTTYPDGNRVEGNPFIKWPERACGILLAAESEWGDPDAVLYDFWKLSDVKAPYKVMAFSVPESRMELARIHDGFAKILAHHRCKDVTAKWLFLGFPWGTEPNAIHTVKWDGEGNQPTLEKLPAP